MNCEILLVGDGPPRRLSMEEAEQYKGGGFLWAHVENAGLDELPHLVRADIPEVAANALTATETRLLDILSASPDHVFSREELLRAAFASEDALSSVDTYVHYIRRKASAEVIETVRGHGYRLHADPA